MNVLFLSPNFPPHYYLFCAALRAHGARVLGIGEALPHEIVGELRAALADYVFVPRMREGDAADRATAQLIARHGRIDRIDSLNEYWLPVEARLREHFNVPGPRPNDLAVQQSKSGMAGIFARAGLEHPATERVTSVEQVRAFVKTHGLPVVFKPDVGVGAARTFSVRNEAELEAVLAALPSDSVIQPYVSGTVQSFDGLTDRQGRIVFVASFLYSAGVMEILNEQRDVYYYAVRTIPPALEEAGTRAVEAFGVRERFFHMEFFARPDGSFVALEMNLRPPGGFTTDLMNYACDVDVYDLWARILTGDDVSNFRYERKYFCAHVSRRNSCRYAVPHDDLVRALGTRLVLWREIPMPFAVAMGDVIYIVRTPALRDLEDAIGLVHSRI